MIEHSIVYRDLRNKHQYFHLGKAQGSELWDRDGKRYIDFTSGWNVANLGWNHPEVNEAVIAQAQKNLHGLLWGSDPVQEEYAAALTAACPKPLDACVKTTSGTEAVECAMKVARAYTGRKKIIGFEDTYHGQSFATLALGASKSMHRKIAPLVPDIFPISFPREELGQKGFEDFLQTLDEQLGTGDVAAVVAEPGIITGWGTTYLAFPGFLQALREMTRDHRAMLIFDEVGTGFSRTGRLFGFEHDDVVPDMLVLAKAQSNGAAAIGTVVGHSEIFEPAFMDAALISTFGWTPVACAAALATLRVHERERLWEAAEKKGAYLTEKLRACIGGKVVGVRGRGLEIGLQFKSASVCERVQQAAFADGLFVVVGFQNNMQLMPPLTTPMDLFEEGIEILLKHIS